MQRTCHQALSALLYTARGCRLGSGAHERFNFKYDFMPMTPAERESALAQMQQTADRFYFEATRIGSHPFIEFAGLMNEYINACRQAHADGTDFSDCNRHSGKVLPLDPVMSDYIDEKLKCIFSGAKVLDAAANHEVQAQLAR